MPSFGYPITEEFQEKTTTDGKTYLVQYFERVRFEWHPENQPPYDVLLGHLAREMLIDRGWLKAGSLPGRETSTAVRGLPPGSRPSPHRLALRRLEC